MHSIARLLTTAVLAGIFVMYLAMSTGAQSTRRAITPKPPTRRTLVVKQIDFAGLQKALTPSKKPLLVNFWATWCDPCREEFPDLVKLHADYGGRIDFITISLDELSEIDRDVPKFLIDMKSSMPAYLFKAVNDDAAIGYVSKDWAGAFR